MSNLPQLIEQVDTLTSMQRVLNSARVSQAQSRVLEWLTCGITPRRLAFTLALGFALGCIPLLGITTAICAVAALAFRLNMPAIQAANWLAMPVQFLLLYPFLRLGEWIYPGRTSGDSLSFTREQLMARIGTAPWHAMADLGTILSHALLAWLITATPALLLMTLLLTPLVTRVSSLAAARVGSCAD